MSDVMDLEIGAVGKIIKIAHDPQLQELSPEAWDRIARYAEALFYHNEKQAEVLRHERAHAGFEPNEEASQ